MIKRLLRNLGPEPEALNRITLKAFKLPLLCDKTYPGPGKVDVFFYKHPFASMIRMIGNGSTKRKAQTQSLVARQGIRLVLGLGFRV